MSNIAHLDTASLDTAAKFFRTMRKAGADFTGPMQSVAKRRNLTEYLEMGCPKVNGNGEMVTNQLPEGYELARLILGNDYVTPEEVATAYGFSYSDEQLECFAETLPDFETILWFRVNGYMLVAGPPRKMNLLEVRELDNKLFYSKTEGWYAEDKQTFSREDTVKVGEWLAIRKGAVPNSFSKTWNEQQDLVTEVEHVPNVPTVSYAVTAYYKVRGIYLLKGVYVRTSSVGSFGYRVDVGRFGRDGLRVDGWWDGDRHGGIGVSSARLPAPTRLP